MSRSDGQSEERKNVSNTSTSTTQRSFQKMVSPQLQPISSEQNSGAITDRSSSFESSISASTRQHGSASRKEVRFREDVVPTREVQQRNHQLGTDGEFIKETSAFRAAMNYDDDDDDDDSDTTDNNGEQREYYQAENDIDEVAYAQTRHVTPVLYEDELGRQNGAIVKLQSPLQQRGERSINNRLCKTGTGIHDTTVTSILLK